MLWCAAVQAQDISQLYTTLELQTIGNRYRPNLRGMWEKGFLPQLTRDERERAGSVILSLPLLGETRKPLEFYSVTTRGQVLLPIASVKFIDDLAVAFAYYEKRGCDVGIVSEYAAVLRFRAQDAKGSPLDTLGVPREAVNDSSVDDLAQKILKSTVFFVAAHEYAHVMYHYSANTAEEAQRQETAADAFALEVLRRIGVAQVGVPFFFLIAHVMEVTPGDFATSAEYELYLQQVASHPVSVRRLLKVAQSTEDDARAFARLQADPASWEKRLQAWALKLREIAQTLDDRRMRRFLGE